MLRQRDDTSDAIGAAALAPEPGFFTAKLVKSAKGDETEGFVLGRRSRIVLAPTGDMARDPLRSLGFSSRASRALRFNCIVRAEDEGPAGSRNGGWRGASKWGWQGMAESSLTQLVVLGNVPYYAGHERRVHLPTDRKEMSQA